MPFFERTVVAASNFKNCMVVNSEIIFFFLFYFGFKHFLQKYGIPLFGISFTSSHSQEGWHHLVHFSQMT